MCLGNGEDDAKHQDCAQHHAAVHDVRDLQMQSSTDGADASGQQSPGAQILRDQTGPTEQEGLTRIPIAT